MKKPASWRLLVGWVFGMGLWPLSAQASARLLYTAPLDSSCPNETAFIDLVRARLGGSPFDPAGEHELELMITTEESELVGTLRWLSPDRSELGRRTVSADDCGELADALAVATSIVLEAIVEEERTAEEELATEASANDTTVQEAGATEAPSTESNTAAPGRDQEEAPPEGDSLHARIGAGVGVGFGVGPLPHTDFSVSGALVWPLFGLRARVHYADTFAEEHVGGGYGLRTRLVRGAIDVCYLPSPFEICGTGSAGMLEGEPSGVREPHIGRAALGTLGASFGGTIALDEHVFLLISAELALYLTRPSFVVGTEHLWTALPVIGQLSVSFLVEP